MNGRVGSSPSDPTVVWAFVLLNEGRRQTPSRILLLRTCGRRCHRRRMKSSDCGEVSTQPASAQRTGPKLLDRVREAVRLRHYSRRTEEAYVTWIRRFIIFHGKRHPSLLGKDEIVRYLTWLAVQQHV